MIDRILFLVVDRDYHRAILEHLRQRRNAFVHSNKESDEPLTLLFQQKFYVESLIHAHIVLCKEFKTRREFFEMLDLSADPAVLATQIASRKRARKKRLAWLKAS